MVANMFAAGMASSGPTLWGFSIFVHPMTEELGWSRGALFGALTARALLMGLVSPIVGRLADNLQHPRPFLILGGTMYAAGVALISVVDSLVAYYLIFVGVIGAGLAISGGYARTAYVAKWFVRQRGRAITMGSMGTGMAALVYPLFTAACIELVGWRGTWVILGATSFLMIVPFAFLVHRQPEDVGLQPDGDTPEQAAAYQQRLHRDTGRTEEHSFSLGEAARMPTLWLLVAMSMVAAPTQGGLSATWVPHFEDIGIPASTAAMSLTIYGVGSVSARFFWGYWVERFHVRRVMIPLMFMLSFSMFWLLHVESAWMAMVYSAYQGFCQGGFVSMNPLLYPTYFGRRHVAAIQGTVQPFHTAAGAGGPFLIATVYDLTGSFRGAYQIIMFTWLIAAGLMYLAKPPLVPQSRDRAVEPQPQSG
jgi:MFS family permease